MTMENFDARFSAYMTDWARKNAKSFRNADEMEAALPDLYTRWLNAPADWLGGETPGLYFAKYDDPELLIRWLGDYLQAGIPIPDPLTERIAELGERACAPLEALLRSDEGGERQMLAISLLSEIDAAPPVEAYLRLIRAHRGEGEIAIRAAEALRTAGARALSACLEAMEGAEVSVRVCLMDMLADFPGEEKIREYARTLLREGASPALMAAYIARLGDMEALPELYAAAKDPQMDYLTFVEVAGAIEALGGDPPEEREFSGDPAYESLRGME